MAHLHLVAPDFIGQGHQGVLPVLPVIYHRNRKSGADGDTACAARAQFQIHDIRQAGDFIPFCFDGAHRADRGARIAGYLLITVKYRKNTLLFYG